MRNECGWSDNCCAFGCTPTNKGQHRWHASKLPIASALPEEFKERFDVIEQSNGYIPNSYLLLAHRPPILKALMDLSKAVIRDEGTLDRGFRFLIAYMSSRTAGCQFCQAHNISSASRWGITGREAQRDLGLRDQPAVHRCRARRLRPVRARRLGRAERGDRRNLRRALKKHYTTPQIVEMTAVIALFGWQNRLERHLAHRSRSAHAGLGGPVRSWREDRLGSDRPRPGFSPTKAA